MHFEERKSVRLREAEKVRRAGPEQERENGELNLLFALSQKASFP